MYFPSDQNNRNAAKTKVSCSNFTSWYVHFLMMRSTFSLLSKGGWEGKGSVGCPIFPFPPVSSFSALVSGWLIQRNNMKKKI